MKINTNYACSNPLYKKHNVKILSIAASVSIVLGLPAKALSNPVLQSDSYVSTKPPENTVVLPVKHGSEPKIVINNSNTGYISFSLKDALPKDITSSVIDKVVLTVFVSSVTKGGLLTIAKVTEPWHERTIPKRGIAPSVDLTNLKTFRIKPAYAGHWIQIDVSGIVKSWVDSEPFTQNTAYGFALISDGSLDAVIDSKENVTTSHQALLDFVLNSKGETGAIGPQGATGNTGAIGPQGATGNTGAIGPQGVTGNTGAIGPQGVTGNTGAIGSQGATGSTGAIGPQGATGDTGAIGPQGATGDTGSIGPQGATGSTGAIGPQGATGSTGAIGPQGPVNLTYVKQSFTADANTILAQEVICPTGRFLTGGGCGYAPLNSGGLDMKVIYNGPDPITNTTTYRCVVQNSGSLARSIDIIAICSSASSVTVP